MFISPQEALSILEHYKYLVIFPITVLEGPIITVIGGFLVYLGYLDFTVAFLLLVLGDWIGDGLHYLLGRYYSRATWFIRMGKFFGYDESKEKIVEEHFRKHPGKTVFLAKFSHGVGGLIQIVAGMAKMNFWKFMEYSLYGALPKTMILVLIGYYLGSSYEKIDKYLNNVAMVVIAVVVGVGLYFLMRSYWNNDASKEDML